MHTRFLRFILLFCACLANASTTAQSTTAADLQKEVIGTERAFAKTMADRDFAGFLSFVSAEAVFMQRDNALRGRDQIAAVWKPWYDAKQVPFSWEPERVEVLNSGTLAISMGPVRDEKGKKIATFSSIWRRDAPGKWHIIFDQGNSVCACEH
jgi:ketosteroid isomerase-like protein